MDRSSFMSPELNIRAQQLCQSDLGSGSKRVKPDLRIRSAVANAVNDRWSGRGLSVGLLDSFGGVS
jgi:hypothetical protein